jgi:hypothetical protein
VHLNLVHDSYARVLIAARLAEAEQRRTAHRLARARRLRRKAVHAAARARRLHRAALQEERRAGVVRPLVT